MKLTSNMVQRSPRKRDSRYSWLVCLGASVSNGLAHSLVYSFGVLLSVLMKEFHQTREKTALIGSLTFGLSYLTSLVSAKICQRFSCRVCHIIGTLTCAASLLITSWATGITYMFFSLSVMYGLGLASAFLPCYVIVDMYFDKRRSVALGFIAAGISTGYFVMGPVMEALVESMGWRNALRTLSGVMLATCFISILFDPNVEQPRCLDNSPEMESDRLPRTIWRKWLEQYFSFCKLPGYIIPVISLVLVSFSHTSVPIHLVRHCEEVGITSKKSSYLYLGIGLGSLVAKIVGGKLCELISPVYLNQIADFCSGISTVALAVTSSYHALVAITILYGVADGLFYTTFNVVVFNAVPQGQGGFAYACLTAAASVTVILGPMTTGFVADRHSYPQALIMAGVITLIGSLVPFLLFCFKGNQQTKEPIEEQQESKL